MNKRGSGPVAMVILFLLLVIVWFAGLGGLWGTQGHNAVVAQGMTGPEALILDNLGFFILLTMIVGIMVWWAFAGAGQ